VRGPTEEAPAHALENIGDNVGVTEEVRERETHLNNLDSMVVHVTMPELPRPPADSKLCYVRMTKHFQMESSEWKGTLTSAAGLATNVVRWRYKKRDGDSMEEDSETREIESNARIVQWSDGSYTMHVGDETLECKHEATENNVHHLFVKQAAEQSATKDPLMMIESHGIVNDRFAVRPFRSSKVSRAIMSTISREFNQRTDKSDLLIKKQVDAAEHAQELAQQESMRMRNQARSAAQKRRSGYGGAMTEDFLERDVEEGDVGGMARQWKQRNRVSNADALRRAKRGAVRGGKRPRDSDESSSSSEDEAPARRRAASPSESSSSSDASDAEEVALKKRAAPAKKSHVVDSSSDDD
jgi:RNA polymerase-associated protein LEO1